MLSVNYLDNFLNSFNFYLLILLCPANVKSGSSSCAEKIVSLLRGVLHPLQVQELSIHGPEDALQWALKISPKQCRILVAGGDGTVGWILNTIFKMNINPIPEVGILPLGTGNDLSRVLGWGAEPPSTITPIEILKNVIKIHCNFFSYLNLLIFLLFVD